MRLENIYEMKHLTLQFTWLYLWTLLQYRFVVKKHFELAKKEPALMLFVFCKFYIFVLCFVTEWVKLLSWIKEHASRGLVWHQLIGDPSWVHIYPIRRDFVRECIAAVCGTKINCCRHQKGLRRCCRHAVTHAKRWISESNNRLIELLFWWSTMIVLITELCQNFM